MRASWFLAGLLFFTLYWVGELYAPFLQNMVIAALLALATHNLDDRIRKRVKYELISATLSTIIITVSIFLPVIYVITSLTGTLNSVETARILAVIESGKTWLIEMAETFPEFAGHIQEAAATVKPEKLLENAFNLLAGFGKLGATFFTDLLLILVFYFFSLLYGRNIMRFFAAIIPLDKRDTEALFLEVTSVMGVVFYSIFTIAVLEGILFGLIVAVYGYDGILLGILYGVSSLIPVVGGLIMWVPVAAYEAVNGSVTNALVILAYSIIVIATIADTFVKPIVIGYINKKIVHTPAQISELLIFFSIIAGLATFGFWGMILGPAITTFFISLLRLYRNLALAEEDRHYLS